VIGLLLAAIAGAAGALAITFWDELRGVIFRWLNDRGYERAAKVFLKVEGAAQRGFRKIKTLVVPEGKTRRCKVEERVVPVSELSPEHRARRPATYDITEQIH
jgi:hypothetical protein